MTDFARFIEDFAGDEGGATAIEYGLIAAGIFLVIVLTVHDLASTINTMYGMIETKVVESIT